MYKIHSLGELDYFCGIKIIRDRENYTITLQQDSYIESLRKRFFSRAEDDWQQWKRGNPLPGTEFDEYDGEPHPSRRLQFAEILGSISYLTICTRLDVAKAHLKLT